MKRHSHELARRLYARHVSLEHITKFGKAIQAACEVLAANPGIKQADSLLHQLSSAETAVRRLRVEMASGVESHGTG